LSSKFPQRIHPGPRIAFVQSSWHKALVDQTRIAFAAHAETLGHGAALVDYFEVPGAFELPLHAKRLANKGRYDAIVCAGLVVDGGIYRHEFVAQAVISGLMQVQLETEVPVISAVLTPHHFHEHGEHHGFFHQHLLQKGEEAAHAAFATITSLGQLARPIRADDAATAIAQRG